MVLGALGCCGQEVAGCGPPRPGLLSLCRAGAPGEAVCQFGWVGRGRDRPGLVSEGGARFPRDPRVARQVAATAQKAGPEDGGLAAVGLVAGWRPTPTRL